MLRPLHVFAGSGVNADHVALVDEQRNADFCAGFQGGGLCGVGSSVALKARICFGYLQFNEERRLYAKNNPFVGEYLDIQVLFYKFKALIGMFS